MESRARDADDPAGESADPPGPVSGPRRRGIAVLRPSRRVAKLYAVLAVLVVGGVAASSLGPVRTILKQSFTDQTKPSVDFYFTGAPYVSGEWIQVPLGVLNGSNSGVYDVSLWTVDAAGKVESTANAKLPYAHGRGEVNVNILQKGDGQIVMARIVGMSLTVHYRYEGSPLGSAFPSPSATS
jgi:hypothetical protein